MATASTSAFVLFGSGPGIGLHVATLFAQKHFQHIILLSRDKDRLEEDAAVVRAARPGIHVTAIACDLSNLQSVRDALAAIDKSLQAGKSTLEVVCFNAARVRPTDLLTEPPEEYEVDFKVSEHRQPSQIFSFWKGVYS
jgi:NAD(P)-dependent dehydrogenase (short-subunit alcohol dehydrogenase family)